MKKVIVIVGMTGAAALLLTKRQEITGFWQDAEVAPTAGDLESNIVSDTMNLFTNWPTGSAPYRLTIEAAADETGVPVEILSWLLWKESRYNPKIISGQITSRAGALGIAQFMPGTAVEWLGSERAALDPEEAIPGAARYLQWLFNKTGSWSKALAAYNWGIGNVQRKGLAVAPAETRDYFTTILAKANSNGSAYA